MYRTIYTICVNYLAKIKAGAGPNTPAPKPCCLLSKVGSHVEVGPEFPSRTLG